MDSGMDSAWEHAAMAQRYIEATWKHGDALNRGDYAAANLAHETIIELAAEIRQLPDKGEALLMPMLTAPSASVVCWAASHLLPVREREAHAALTQLVNTDSGMAGFSAKMILIEWKAKSGQPVGSG